MGLVKKTPDRTKESRNRAVIASSMLFIASGFGSRDWQNKI
jgi:hypothetical protein